MKILVAFGTRPEAIKMAPIVWELKRRKIPHITIITAQHRYMLDQMLKILELEPDYDLNIMRQEQTLSDISINIFKKINKIYNKENPDLVLVQGDTLTSFIVSLAAFYDKIPVGHVEAGLRTYKKYYPFPEEIDRQLIDIIADLYFAPTQSAMANLLKEGKDKSRIFITGNTVVDTLLTVSNKDYPFSQRFLSKLDFKKHKVILIETHRREIWGKTMKTIHRALKKFADRNKDVMLVFSVHRNPVIQHLAQKFLASHKRIILLPTLDYKDLIKLLKNIYFVITDSGGLQEEAPTFGKPVLVVRQETERIEGVKAGIAKLVGFDPKNIVLEAEKLVKDQNAYKKMAKVGNPYGDGKAAKRIVDIILRKISTIKK